MRVLIVDDDDEMRRLVRRWVERTATVAIAGEAVDSIAALRDLDSAAVDVILSDVTMPIMDGIHLTREVKALYPAIHVVLLTSRIDHETQEEAREAGASGFLSKSESGKQIPLALEAIEKIGPDRRRGPRSRVIEAIWL